MKIKHIYLIVTNLGQDENITFQVIIHMLCSLRDLVFMQYFWKRRSFNKSKSMNLMYLL